MKQRLILVGGFLGAGKTTLLSEAASVLADSGLRVGLITNDQAPELVDTAFLSQGDRSVTEVSGSCFCCNFPGLLRAMTHLKTEANADVLIAEPVGSCTDLSATIVQPLRDLHHAEVVVSPLSVLADPTKLMDILDGGTGGLHPSAAYIFRKQMEEADILVITKTDLLSSSELESLMARVSQLLPLATVFAISAKTGEGVETWLAEVMGRSDAGRQLAEVDYDIYAEGEAVLGWLNATYSLEGSETEWNAFASQLLGAMSERFDAATASVGHVKLMIEAGEDSVLGNLTGLGETLSIRGGPSSTTGAKLTVNARVEMSPAEVEAVVQVAIDTVCEGRLQVEKLAFRCLSPGRPTPSYRYSHLISLA